MELKIYSPQEDGFIKKIEWNFDELKAEIKSVIKEKAYDTVVYSEDQIKDAKSDRAKLNKLMAALENERKSIKNQCMQPYSDFEKQEKELINIIKEAVQNIDSQIKGYEEQQREEKKKKVYGLYEEIVPEHLREFLPFDVVLVDRYLNATTTLKSISIGISELVTKTQADLDAISRLPEYVFEATEKYKQTLNLTHCIAYANDLREQAEKKRIFEEQRAMKEAQRQEQIRHESETLANIRPEMVHDPLAYRKEATESDIWTKDDERKLTIQFKVTAKESQFENVNRLLSELKASCEAFEIVK